MKFQTKSRENFSQLFVSVKIPLIPKTFRLNAMLYATPETWVHGYSSRTKDGKYVLFHDYDSLDFDDVIEELKILQKEFGLSNYYLFELDRDNSYHAVCLDKMSLAEVYEIQKKTSCDLAFVHSIKIMRNKEWILRWGPKGERDGIKFMMKIKSKNDSKIKSTAHAQFLKKFGPRIDAGKGKWDGIRDLGFVDYNTANRTEGERNA